MASEVKRRLESLIKSDVEVCSVRRTSAHNGHDNSRFITCELKEPLATYFTDVGDHRLLKSGFTGFMVSVKPCSTENPYKIRIMPEHVLREAYNMYLADITRPPITHRRKYTKLGAAFISSAVAALALIRWSTLISRYVLIGVAIVLGCIGLYLLHASRDKNCIWCMSPAELRSFVIGRCEYDTSVYDKHLVDVLTKVNNLGKMFEEFIPHFTALYTINSRIDDDGDIRKCKYEFERVAKYIHDNFGWKFDDSVMPVGNIIRRLRDNLIGNLRDRIISGNEGQINAANGRWEQFCACLPTWEMYELVSKLTHS